MLNGCDKIVIPNHSHILTVKAFYFKLKHSYQKIFLKIKNSFLLDQSITHTSLPATQLQTININLALRFGHMSVELVLAAQDEEILLLIEYRLL